MIRRLNRMLVIAPLIRFSRGLLRLGLLCFVLHAGITVRAQTLQLVLPSQTDANITQYNDYCYVYVNGSVASRGQLFVCLPGTGGRPAGYTDLLKVAANLGFNAIGLMYPNAVTMNSLCADSTNPDCYAETRLAVINGGTNAQISVSSADSITNRLTKLLAYLATNQPSQNWGQFLTAQSTLNWPKIAIAGHSQGAGHAGLIAKVYPVARALMFSDTDWWTPNGRLPGQPADWIASPGVTSPEYYFGFIHQQDGLIPYATIIPTWQNYGLNSFGPPTLVESNSLPYHGSHELTTDLPPQDGTSGLNCHDATAVNGATPLASDGITPIYEPVWQYMMTAPPKLPRLSITQLAANQFQLSFNAYTNYGYQVQAATNPDGAWTNAGSLMPGNGEIETTTVNRSTTTQFYRLQVVY